MSLASFRLYAAKNPSIVLLAVLGLLLFGTGWYIGRAMSPYYASHPIVFNDAKCTEDSKATTAELLTLQQQGTAARLADAATPEPPQIAGATTESPIPTSSAGERSTSTPTPAAPVEQKTFVGSKNSDKYHHISCSTWQRIKEENRIWFATREEAESRGYQPTECTKQVLGTN